MAFLPPAEPWRDRPVASLGERSAAHLLDVCCQGVLQAVLLVLLARDAVADLVVSQRAEIDIAVLLETLQADGRAVLVSVLLGWALGGFVEVIMYAHLGATIGKLALGLETLDAATGERLGWRRATARWLGLGWMAPAGLVSPAAQLLPFAGYALAWFDPRRRALHDRVAGAVVVRRDRA